MNLPERAGSSFINHSLLSFKNSMLFSCPKLKLTGPTPVCTRQLVYTYRPTLFFPCSCAHAPIRSISMISSTRVMGMYHLDPSVRLSNIATVAPLGIDLRAHDPQTYFRYSSIGCLSSKIVSVDLQVGQRLGVVMYSCVVWTI